MQYLVSPSPHIRSSRTTRSIMLDVILALCPALIASTVIFGGRVLLLTAVCVGSSILIEYLCQLARKKDQTIGDLSAVVTGMLLAMNLPVSTPLWVAMIGSFFAIAVAKQLFGGIGQNFANPALTGRILLLMSFSGYLTTRSIPLGQEEVDAIAAATPLARMAAGESTPTLLQMFLGVKSSCAMGEVSAAALLLGGVYLVIRKVIKPITPLVFVGTVFLLSGALGMDPVAQILSGGLMLGAIFMATDYATTPATGWGKAVFGLGCGIITVLIRKYGSYPEGVSFAILLMNILTPQIDKAFLQKPLGGKKVAKNA